MVLEVLASEIRQEKQRRGIMKRKKIKLPLFLDGMLVYINPKESLKIKLLKLIIDFTKVPEYNVSIYNSIICLYTSKKKNGKIIFFLNIICNSIQITIKQRLGDKFNKVCTEIYVLETETFP